MPRAPGTRLETARLAAPIPGAHVGNHLSHPDVSRTTVTPGRNSWRISSAVRSVKLKFEVMSSDPPPPYAASYGAPSQPYGAPAAFYGAQPDGQKGTAQYGPPHDAYVAQQPMYGQPTYAGGPPSVQPYPPGAQVYPPGAQAYPPGAHVYPPGTQPYPSAPTPSVGVTVTAAPVLSAAVVTTAVIAGPPIPCGPSPIQVTCPGCHAMVITSTSYQTGLLTWIIFAVLFFLGFWLCCFIPFCVNDCKDVIHQCPNCRTVVGKYTRM